MPEGPSSTKFGRYASPAPPQFRRLAVHDGRPLREVRHGIPIPVLDQEDLFAQLIDTSELVPGAPKVAALGSCTTNAGTAHIAERHVAAGKPLDQVKLAGMYASAGSGLSATDSRFDEEFAILLYHAVTQQTGDPATEWPAVDCGSSGYYVCTELERLGLATSYKSGAGVLGALALLQDGTVMQGTPWFNDWMEPDAQGFIDGDGSWGALEAAIYTGVAGGHETLQYGIPQLAQDESGAVDLQRTVIRARNSWSANWNGALTGDFLVHASTLSYLAAYCDFKQAVVG